jgi:nicotinic acid mononucleotide adenylyltransferase
MLDATKYMNRLRVYLKGADEMLYMKDWEKFDYLYNRVNDIIKDYDRDFDNAMEEMEVKEMFNMKRGDPYAEGTG